MKHKAEDYSKFVEHPRYGQRPRFTGLNPENNFSDGVHLHWHSPEECRIPDTAIPAYLSQQTMEIFQVTHYFDVKRTCRDCGKPFIFFAEEQKYWYEVLNFGLDSDCVRCAPCRKKLQGISHTQQRYEVLFHISERTFEQNLEMADCCLTLIETGVFNARKLQFARMLLKSMNNESNEQNKSKANDLGLRIQLLEAKEK